MDDPSVWKKLSVLFYNLESLVEVAEPHLEKLSEADVSFLQTSVSQIYSELKPSLLAVDAELEPYLDSSVSSLTASPLSGFTVLCAAVRLLSFTKLFIPSSAPVPSQGNPAPHVSGTYL